MDKSWKSLFKRIREDGSEDDASQELIVPDKSKWPPESFYNHHQMLTVINELSKGLLNKKSPPGMKEVYITYSAMMRFLKNGEDGVIPGTQKYGQMKNLLRPITEMLNDYIKNLACAHKSMAGLAESYSKLVEDIWG